jgi:hypothetical protein
MKHHPTKASPLEAPPPAERGSGSGGGGGVALLGAFSICSFTIACAAGGAEDAGRSDAGRTIDAGRERDAGRSIDAGMSDAGTIDAGMFDAGRFDAGMIDGGRTIDAGMTDGGSDAGPDAGMDAGRIGPVSPGTYSYRRVPVGALREAHIVAFHPDGAYAIVLERSDYMHMYDWASDTATRIDVRVSSRTVMLDDVAFAPDGSVAWIVGHERVGTAETGVILRFDDARWRAGDGAASFTRTPVALAGERFTGIEIPTADMSPSETQNPVVLSQSGTSPYIARLRELDPTTGTFTGLFVARSTSAGCDDLAFVANEFGQWGIVLACGTNGASAPFYTEIAGIGEWRDGPVSLGNVSRTDAHPSHVYALIVNWSSQYLHRFESGAFRPTSTSPALATSIYDVSFAPDGLRALVVGRPRGSPLRGTVFEYRHDLWSAGAITEVSIPSFDAAPYLATNSTYLYDSAFRPGCEGGVIVGGATSFSGSTGLLIEFAIEGGRRCRP